MGRLPFGVRPAKPIAVKSGALIINADRGNGLRLPQVVVFLKEKLVLWNVRTRRHDISVLPDLWTSRERRRLTKPG